jgi:RNA polymerase sigma-70 factor (ECF subfamily)
MPAGLDDPRRFARAFAEHAPEVRAAAAAVLRDPVGADDVVQDVFLRLWRQPHAWDPARGALGPFLRLMARSRALDLWREAEVRQRVLRRAVEMERPEPRPEGDDGPDAAALRAAERAELVATLRTLPHEQRRAIALAYWGGLTAEEIAVRSDVPLGTAKSRVRLGLRRLRAAERLEPLAA